jgi:hypothetical protein
LYGQPAWNNHSDYVAEILSPPQTGVHSRMPRCRQDGRFDG